MTAKDTSTSKKLVEALQESEQRLGDFFDNASSIFWIKDLGGRFLRINHVVEEVIGKPAEEIVGKTVDELFSKAEADAFKQNDEQVIATGKTIEFEETNTTDEGVNTYLSAKFPLRDTKGQIYGIGAICTDITTYRKTKSALRMSEARLRLAQQVAQIGTFDLDIASGVTTWTPELETLYGLESGQFDGTEAHWAQMIHPEDRASTVALNVRAIQTGEPLEGEWRVQWPDGSIHWVFGRFQTIKDAKGHPVRLVGVNIDITDRKTIEREVLHASEIERRRVAADLHDGICQVLMGISFEAEAVQFDLNKEGHPLAPSIGKIAKRVAQASVETRAAAHGLDPVLTGSDGLMLALKELTRKTTQLHGLHCLFECHPPVLMPDAGMSSQLYRIAQEAVHNSVRHSGAQQANVELSETDSEIQLVVRDNGCGLLPDALPTSGFGLRGMTYRAKSMRGHLTVRNNEQGGVDVTCRVPKLVT